MWLDYNNRLLSFEDIALAESVRRFLARERRRPWYGSVLSGLPMA